MRVFARQRQKKRFLTAQENESYSKRMVIKMSVNNLEASVDEQLESAEGSFARAEHTDTYITGQTKSKGVYEFFKRAFDIVCSFLASVILLVPMAVISLLIIA